MNFLAHLLLAGPDPLERIGQLMGDFHKGPLGAELEPALRLGIWLHRRIDAYTDAHAVVVASRGRVRPELRRYAGILVDLYYDHFLACDWARYHPKPLEEFVAAVHGELLEHYARLPPRMQRSVDYLIERELLLSYRELSGIARALRGISGRLSRPNPLAEGVVDLERHYTLLQADFATFFPELRAYVGQLRAGAVPAPVIIGGIADRESA
ncbi:MAG TPA: ACP phosphodiesterase [Candidatus Competibacteraceae bacterium]|nr:ACP phosphodiesterase [Candidatus Competibacteraceae bacterium]